MTKLLECRFLHYFVKGIRRLGEQSCKIYPGHLKYLQRRKAYSVNLVGPFYDFFYYFPDIVRYNISFHMPRKCANPFGRENWAFRRYLKKLNFRLSRRNIYIWVKLWYASELRSSKLLTESIH